MAFFLPPERGIGRGEIAESHIEAPFIAVFMLLSALALVGFHVYLQNTSYTAALAVSMLVFGVTLVRVEYGLYILVIAMLMSPEIQAGSVGARNERTINLRYDDVLIGIIFLAVLVRQAFERRPLIYRNSPINSGIFLYGLVCILSTLGALRMSVPAWDRSVAFFVMAKMFEFYMIFFMVGVAIRDREEVRRQLTVFFFVSVLVCTYAIMSIGTSSRVSAPFDSGGTEPTTLGGYLTILICVALGLFAYAPTRKKKYLFALLALIAFIPFIMTLSRASYIALLVAMTALSIVGRQRIIIVAVALILILSPILMPQDVKDRVNYTFQRGTGVPVSIPGVDTDLQIDKSTYERIYIWKKVRFNLGVWPWLGGGISWENVLDSQYARILIETGILGFTAFAFLLFQIMRTTRQAFRWSRDWMLKGLSLGMVATTVGLIVHGMGTISFLIVRIMEPFWFLLALCVVARHIALEEYGLRLREYYAALQREQELVGVVTLDTIAKPDREKVDRAA